MRLYIHLKNTQSNDDRNGFCSSHNRQFVYRHRVPHTGILSKIVPLLQPQRVKLQNFETLRYWSLSDSGAHVSSFSFEMKVKIYENRFQPIFQRAASAKRNFKRCPQWLRRNRVSIDRSTKVVFNQKKFNPEIMRHFTPLALKKRSSERSFTLHSRVSKTIPDCSMHQFKNGCILTQSWRLNGSDFQGA